MDSRPISRNIILIFAGVAAIAILGMAGLSYLLLSQANDRTGEYNQATVAAIAASTLAAVQTEPVIVVSPTQVLIIPPASESASEIPQEFTPTPTNQIVPTNTPLSLSSPTPSPTVTPLPTTALPPTATVPTAISGGGSSSGGSGGSSGSGTSVASRCNWAQLVEDVTIPDGSVIGPGTRFTKTWKVKNIGTCAWTREYSVVFSNGKRMEGTNARLPSRVNPGETINISIDMQAPDTEGDYTGEWMIKTPEDNRFGTGGNARNPLTVEIEVDERASGVVYDFIINYCAAEWENKSTELDCPGTEGDDDGFVVRVNDPALESRLENEPALWTQPENIEDGLIQGTYPAYTVEAGDHFRATIGCLAGYDRCKVMFQLKYQIGNNDIRTLGSWDEVYDGNTTRIDIDLTSLAGEKVKFILIVKADGTSRDDAAFWLVPQISR